jgi:hypothetical protein
MLVNCVTANALLICFAVSYANSDPFNQAN